MGMETRTRRSATDALEKDEEYRWSYRVSEVSVLHANDWLGSPTTRSTQDGWRRPV